MKNPGTGKAVVGSMVFPIINRREWEV